MNNTQQKSNNKPKVPTLRFPEFRGEWDVKKLGEVFERITRKNKEGNQNVLTISAQQGLINQENFFTKSVAAKDLSGYYLLLKGEFAYNRSYSKGHPVGAIKQLKKYAKGVVSTLYICFGLRDRNHLGDFFDQYFNAGKLNREIAKITQEGARNHGLLNMSASDFFNDVMIIIPPQKEEQRKIAQFLSMVDEWIENLKKQKEKWEEYKKGLMQQLFPAKGESIPRLRFPEFSGEWEEKRLGEVCNKRSSGISANSLAGNKGNYIVYGANGSLKKINYYQYGTEYISIVKDGAGVGRVLMCQPKTSILGTMDAIFPKGNINLYFIYLLLKKIKLGKYTSGSTIPHIYFKDYSREKIKIPSLLEQRKVADFLSKIDQVIESKQLQIKKAKAWKKGLMQRMFV